MLASIAQQQRSGVDELRGRRLSAVRECFQPAAFFFGKGNLISGCHAPIINQQKSAVNMRNVTCYNVLGASQILPACQVRSAAGRAIRHFGCNLEGRGPFPLTPTISPKEREPRRQRLGKAGASVLLAGRAAVLPFLRGEGRGE